MTLNSFDFSLITYNIHKGVSPLNRQFTLPQITERLRQAQPDFVCLQEVAGTESRRKRHVDPYSFFTHPEAQHSHYAKNVETRLGHHGNAIWSRHAFDRVENIRFSFFPYSSRSMLHGEFIWNENRIHVICLHLGLFEVERSEQVRKLVDRIQAHVPDSDPLIVAGDTNDWLGKLEPELIGKVHLKEAFKEIQGKHQKTFPCRFPLLPVDRIYFRGVELLDARVPLEPSDWIGLSDHLPLEARFRFSPS